MDLKLAPSSVHFKYLTHIIVANTFRELNYPMASSDLSSSISNITSRIQGLTSKGVDIQNDLAAQAALLQLSQELLATVQSPNDIISSMAYSVRVSKSGKGLVIHSLLTASQGVRNATIRTSIDLGLFDILSADGPVAVAEVASKTGAETELILRLLRALDGMGFAKQVDTDSFAATPVSRQMTLPNIQAGVRFLYAQALLLLSRGRNIDGPVASTKAGPSCKLHLSLSRTMAIAYRGI